MRLIGQARRKGNDDCGARRSQNDFKQSLIHITTGNR
ncbi:MAG: hypothetical protein V7641_1380 [Blastocatellia bacterium]